MWWNDHKETRKLFGEHAFLSPSSYSWVNYTDEKLADTYINKLAVSRGTALHTVAADLIKLKIRLPDTEKTLNQYVNDAITLSMVPEQALFYSKFCFGTADTICVEPKVLRIHDLKTGITKASFMQLRIYAALFFLEYENFYKPGDLDIELRIYQNDEVRIEQPETDDILPIMDTIIRFSRHLEVMEEQYDDGFDALGSRSR